MENLYKDQNCLQKKKKIKKKIAHTHTHTHVVELKWNIQFYYATKSLLRGELNMYSTYCILPKKVRETEQSLYFFSPE